MLNASLAVACLLTVALVGSLEPPAVGSSAFDAVRLRLAGVPADSALAPFAAEAGLRVGKAEAFRAALDLPSGPDRSRALLALAGGDGAMAGPVAFTRPSEAFAALAASHGVAVDAAELAVLDSHPLARPLATVADRFLLFQGAAQAAYGALAAQALDDLPALYAEMGAASTWTPADAEAFASKFQLPAVPGSAMAHLLDARAGLALATLDLAFATQSLSTSRAALQIDATPAFALDLDGADSTYLEDIVLTIDVGGNDLYLNNAGGSNIDPLHLRCPNIVGSFSTGAGTLIDLGAGDDRHESWRTCGINGGGHFGAGFLYDEGGRDTYYASSGGVNGGGWAGLGFLYDAGAGDDNYTGFASTGRLGTWGVNGGGMGQGEGFLVDEGGSDVYIAGVGGTNGGGYNQGGRGLLVDDGEGADLYSADWLGTNGGGNAYAAGALLDGGGDDTYLSSTFIDFGYGTNGGAAGAVGLLYDAGGNDVYSALDAGTNGGAQAGVGLLVDEGGNDSYTGTGAVANGAANLGLGLLWDRAGTDTYSDALVNCTDCDMVPKGLVGFQLDD